VAGHNKWSKIKHRKAVVDKRRGTAWSKCSKAIMVAAKHGGADPESNLALRYAIDEARYANMPRDTIERAIKKGAGELGAEDWEAIRYEGFGPHGVAVLVEALTNNRTRTANDVRNIFAGHGGNLGATGCVGYLFDSTGVIEVAAGPAEEDIMQAAIDAGARDVVPEEDRWRVTTDPADLHAVKSAFERAGLTLTGAALEWVPNTTARLGAEEAEAVVALLDELEENDDVQKVWSNADLPEA